MGMRVLNLVCKKRELIKNKYDKNTMSRKNVVRAEKSRQEILRVRSHIKKWSGHGSLTGRLV